MIWLKFVGAAVVGGAAALFAVWLIIVTQWGRWQ